MRNSPSRRVEARVALEERWLSTDQVAEALGVSRRTVDRWKAAGCPSMRIPPRLVRYSLAEVIAWLREQERAEDDASEGGGER